MNWVEIKENGVVAIKDGIKTAGESATLYAPAVLPATIEIGYMDKTSTFVPLTDGTLIAGDQLYIKQGLGGGLIINVTGITAIFHIGMAFGKN